jgi:glycosyltransferase involved in cell wall biosynthesis/GT2 family glycosyltransferase/SAM-dependent methyltransferase
MEDTRSFAGSGYALDPATGVWVAEGHKGFAYSDGDAAEEGIFDAVRSARDVSRASDELPQRIRDWPGEYHLSPVRGNIMAPFRIGKGARVLELGCGMGAITRYLGETGAEVTAVEGSLRRAAIARARCRDLANVRVVCDNFRDFRADGKFDIVTLIGVMEYSPKFIGGDDPIGACLSVAKGLLAPEGALIVAIENRLGLKYWNNCSEDHTGGMFDSIHDTYPPGTVETPGYGELKAALAKAGFASVEFLFPFPDYKLPSVILREKALGERGISFASIIGQHFSRDYSGQRLRHFSERLAWKTIERNGLVPHLANSFLCACTLSSEVPPPVAGEWFVKAFNSSRRACFRTETTIRREEGSGRIRVGKERMHPGLPVPAGPLSFNPDVEESYVDGPLLSDEIQRAVLRRDTLDEFFRKMNDYKDAVVSLSRKLSPGIGAGRCPGALFDCTPFNLIRSADGGLRYIDNEWVAEGDLPLNYVLLRGIVIEVTNKLAFLDNPFLFRQFDTLAGFAARTFEAMGLRLSPEDIAHYCRYEAEIQAQVMGGSKDREALREQLEEVFSGPLDRTLGLDERLPVRDVCRMMQDGSAAERRERAAAAKVASLLSERLEKTAPRPAGSGTKGGPVPPAASRYDVLIPVYNAFEHLRRCIDSVLRHTGGDHAVYLLDDASPDPRVLPLLRSYEKADARVRVIGSEKNKGFIRNTNRGFGLSQNDVVILNSDTEVTEGWLDRMDRCRRSRPDVGVVCPLSNNATILSIPVMNEDNGLPEGMDPAGFGRLVAEVSPAGYPELPTGVGFCMLITRDTLKATGFFDTAFGMGYGEENDLCQKARKAGKKIVCCDDAYVHHYGKASFGVGDAMDEKRRANEMLLQRRWPEYLDDVYRFCCANPFRELQERLAAGLRAGGGPGLPSVLHVIHKFGTPGGTELHTRSIIDGLASRYRSTVIHPSCLPGKWVDVAAREEADHLRVLEVRKESGDACELILGAHGDLSNGHAETVFSNVLKGGGYGIVHFQHLSNWGTLLLPLIAKRHGCRVVLSLHDYYLLCPEYNLLLPDLKRCGKAMADGEDAECVYCLGTKRHHQGDGRPAHLPDYLAERRQILRRVFEAADVLVAPSDFTRDLFIRACGDAMRGKIVTVPHGIGPLRKVQPGKRKGALRVGFLGNATDRKGVFVLLHAAHLLKRMKAPVLFEIFGDIPAAPAELAEEAGIVLRGGYERGELPRLLSKTDVVLIPSIWDETFCLTASEAQMMGIPVLASDAGAIGERIIDGKTGFLFPPNDVKALAEKLMRLQKDPALLERVSANLRDLRLKTLEENIEDYGRIYDWLRDGVASGRSGDGPAPGLPALVEGGRVKGLLAEGEERFSRGDVSSAMRIFRRVLEIDGRNSQALNDLGVVQWQSGDAVAAVDTFQVALGFNPGDSDALSNLADAAAATGRYDLLKADLLERLGRAQPEHPGVERLAGGLRGGVQARG